MNIKSWLKKQMISSDAYRVSVLLDHFLDEMKRGLAGRTSSLAMIPSYIGTGASVPVGKSVAVIDAGGTNLRICVASFDEEGEVSISGFSQQPMPGRDKEISAAEFYDLLVHALQPMRDQFDTIGFCFSYPAEILSNYDGRLLHWTKEIKIPEMVGTHVGEGLIAALEHRGITGKRVVVLNDTVACLLAGRARGQAFEASSYVGFILGTGTNTAYVEQNERIGKLGEFTKEGAQVINVESGGFSSFKRGAFDLKLDVQSEKVGVHIFEKVISGVYLGSLALELLQALIAEGVFSDVGSASLSVMNDLSTIHINNLTLGDGRDTGVLGTEAFTDKDREIMRTVFTAVVDRVALFTAVNILAGVVKSGAGKDAKHPVCVNIDGSTYYKTCRLEEKVQAHLKGFLKSRGLHIRCIQIDDSPIVGAAIAGLTAFKV